MDLWRMVKAQHDLLKDETMAWLTRNYAQLEVMARTCPWLSCYLNELKFTAVDSQLPREDVHAYKVSIIQKEMLGRLKSDDPRERYAAQAYLNAHYLKMQDRQPVPDGVELFDMDTIKQKQAAKFAEALNEHKIELGELLHQNFQKRLREI